VWNKWIENLPFENLWILTIKIIKKIKNYGCVFFAEIQLLSPLNIVLNFRGSLLETGLFFPQEEKMVNCKSDFPGFCLNQIKKDWVSD
jgi:hypothetical protein